MAKSLDKPLNVCLLIGGQYPPYPHGGVASFAVDLGEGLVKRGQRVTCVSFYSEEQLGSSQPIFEEMNGVELVRVPLLNEKFPPRLQALMQRFYNTSLIRKLHKERNFDLIEGEDGGGRLALGRLPKVPLVVRLHATTIYNDFVLKRKPSRLMHLLERIWLRRADYYVAVSNFVGETTFNLLNMKPKYTVIPYAIDLEHFRPLPEIEVKKQLIVFTGVIAKRKGVKELLEAIPQVYEKYPDAELWLVGDDSVVVNGERYANTLYSQLPEAVRGKVKFMGNSTRENLPALLQQAEVCCFPSHVETFGIGIIEAMAIEKPVVYMKHGPGPEVLEDGVSGLLADTFSPEDIAEKINYLLGHPDEARKMGQEGRKRVQERFERERWVEKNLDYYRSCVEEYNSKKETKS